MITLLHCSRERADRRASGTAQGPGSVLPCAPVRDRELAAKAPVEGAAAIPEASPFGGAEAREGRLPFMMPPSTWDSISGGITAVFTSYLLPARRPLRRPALPHPRRAVLPQHQAASRRRPAGNSPPPDRGQGALVPRLLSHFSPILPRGHRTEAGNPVPLQNWPQVPRPAV